MPDTPNPELCAREALAVLGLVPARSPRVLRGAWNWIGAYDEFGLAVRVSPAGCRHEVSRGYIVAEYVGAGVAIAPQFVLTTYHHLVAVLTLGTSLGVSPRAWVSAQRLGALVHRCDVARLRVSLKDFDAIHDLDERLGRLNETRFEPWVTEMQTRGQLVRDELAEVQRPRVLLHGDLHAGQCVSVDDEPRLIDFDLAMYGETEADWGRITAWHHSGLVNGHTLDEALAEAGEDLDQRRVELYATAYALRYVSAMALRVIDGASAESTRLSALATMLGLNPGPLREDLPVLTGA